jgi:hypothetical protein
VQPLGNRSRGFRRTFIDPVEFCDRSQQLTPMSERCDPEFFQVLVCQIRKDAKVDVILSDALSVLPETDLSGQSETCCIAAAPAVSGSTARISKST